MDELTPSEWDWLEAYRSEYGLPEDRLRHYFAVLIYFMTNWLAPEGIKGVSARQAEQILNPFRPAGGKSKKSRSADEGEAETVKPAQQAAMVTAAFRARRR